MATKPEQSEAEKLIRKNISAYNSFVNSPSGKMVMEDLKKSYYYRPIFDPNPYIMAGNAAQRDLVQKMINLGDADPKNVHIEVKT